MTGLRCRLGLHAWRLCNVYVAYVCCDGCGRHRQILRLSPSEQRKVAA